MGCPLRPPPSRGAARGLCVPAAQLAPCLRNPAGPRGPSPASAGCGRSGEGSQPPCRAGLGWAGGRRHHCSSWEPAESQTRSLGCHGRGDQPACALPPRHPLCLVLPLWGAGRDGCPCWSQFPVPKMWTREQPGHHRHSAPGQCRGPEHLVRLAELSPCPAAVPPAAQGLFLGGRTWQPKTRAWGGGTRGRGGLAVPPWWGCVLPGLERSRLVLSQ